MRFISVFVSVILFNTFRLSTAYKAAVFEHYALQADTPENTILKNLDEYRNHADKAKIQAADIAVFPEYGLTTVILDNPEEYAVVVNSTNHIINELMTIAKERAIYLVVNLLEKEEEANKKTKYYNTNLVFDRDGKIILKYRKINLFNEGKLTAGPKDQTPTFTTDFGVTFGIFTCFDILFENPSRTVLKNDAVTDIVFPTAWFATMPFFTSLSIQHGYAAANGVNLLAANFNNPKETHGGSGIYLGDGRVVEMVVFDTPSSKPLIQEVPKLSKREDKSICPKLSPFGLPNDLTKSNVSNYHTDYEFKASNYKLKKIDLTQSNVTTTICDSTFCCNFEIIISTSETNTSSVYKVMAYDGPVSYGNVNAHIRVCSLVACESDSDTSCGKRVDVGVKFTKITVKGDLITDETYPTYYTPLTLNTYLQPLTQTIYCNNKNSGSNSTSVQLTTTKAQKDVLVFGILGTTTASAAAPSVYACSVLFVTILSLIKYIVI
ncbi:vanin-like protein 1 [Tribolium castaneum]|uniref:vanin-like protein 1 n=1 Tax=Tribolium castaneum TaxID=7070 RepID=UPI00046BFB2C|nr:PREDICTED: vanin-like protein 1 [Tribolium castaneum]|eukprot:XP_008196019.1 PREDICTED: vanin-like protein 1 [Tribolium castaneum]